MKFTVQAMPRIFAVTLKSIDSDETFVLCVEIRKNNDVFRVLQEDRGRSSAHNLSSMNSRAGRKYIRVNAYSWLNYILLLNLQKINILLSLRFHFLISLSRVDKFIFETLSIWLLESIISSFVSATRQS